MEEIKTKIFSGEFENPTQEFERIKKEREEMYKPKILIDVNLEQEKQREREVQRERERDAERQSIKDRERAQKERYVEAKASRELAALDAEPIESTDSSNDAASPHNPHNNNSERVSSSRASESHDLHSNVNGLLDEDSRSSLKSNNSPISAETPPSIAPGISLNLNANAKKKRIEVKDIFNSEDDSEDINGPKKRKLVPLGTCCMQIFPIFFSRLPKQIANNSNAPRCFPLRADYEDNASQTKSSKAANAAEANNSQTTAASTGNSNSSSKRKESRTEENSNRKEDNARTQEEKRRHIKSIIDKIPTGKADLFNFKLDWTEIDNTLMEKKIRPWINKKIIEYIGEPEPTLVDFICSKVMAGSTPQGILDDVQMVSIRYAARWPA